MSEKHLRRIEEGASKLEVTANLTRGKVVFEIRGTGDLVSLRWELTPMQAKVFVDTIDKAREVLIVDGFGDT